MQIFPGNSAPAASAFSHRYADSDAPARSRKTKGLDQHAGQSRPSKWKPVKLLHQLHSRPRAFAAELEEAGISLRENLDVSQVVAALADVAGLFGIRGADRLQFQERGRLARGLRG